MAPIAKENETLTATPEAAVRTSTAATSSDAGKVQPVALEVPVSVNGARTVEGSDKREPFAEATKTVLVFGNGAVIRLQSPVAAGQLLFLTNEKTKKEVVCQVVKSKNYRNVSGYVELEFTEPVVGFWGMRFPGDRIATQSTGAPSVTANPKPLISPSGPASPVAALHPASPAVSAPRAETPAPPAAKPAAPSANPDAAANFNALKSILGAPSTETPVTARPVAPATVPPAAFVPSTPVKPASPLAGPASEELKQQTARLQEQLSSMLFSELGETAGVPATPKSGEAKTAPQDFGDTAVKILDFAKPPAVEPPAGTQAAKPVSTAKPANANEEVKIPSWLEPLARNAANAPAPAEDPTKLPPDVLEPMLEEHIASSSASSPLPLSIEEASPATGFGGGLLDPIADPEASAGGSRKGILIALIAAAALVIAAAGTWYLRNEAANPTPRTSAPISSAAASRIPDNSGTSSPAALGPAAANPAAPNTTAPAASVVTAANPNSSTERAASASKGPSVQNMSAPVPVEKPEAPAAEPKKPSLGHVKLAAPNVVRTGKPQLNADPDPGIAMGNGDAPVALSGMISNNASQPVAPSAPVPVGGDVTPARLISTVHPLYPSLARAQHIAGDVKIDALIDANGHVTTMKIVSGPTLLHQAAMDALRQWKYQPATLDSKPVPMHLTVTIQFRLQ